QYDPTNEPIIQVAVHGGGLPPARLYDLAANEVAPVLEGIEGVASASTNGGKERQINIIVDPAKAAARGLSADDVAKAIDRTNALLPSGRFNPPDFSANVYTNAVATNVSDIGDAILKLADGSHVRIKD